MSSQLELEKLRSAVASLNPGSAASAQSCLTSEQLWQAVSGELPAEELKALALHSSECLGCAQRWRLAREIQVELNGGVARANPRRRWSGGWGALVAAAVLVTFALGLWVWIQPTPEPAMRAVSDITIVSLVPAGETLSRENFLLRWESSAELDQVNVRLLSQDLTILFEADAIEQREVRIPPAVLSDVVDSTELIWIIRGVGEDGKLIEQAFKVQVGSLE